MSDKRTQTQMRIGRFARTGERFHPNIYFVDNENYRARPFLEKDDHRFQYLKEEDVKTGKTYKEIRPAVQSRLAQMDSFNDFERIINRKTKIGRFFGGFQLTGILIRNNRLRNKAINSALKREGGIIYLLMSNALAHNFLHMDHKTMKERLQYLERFEKTRQ